MPALILYGFFISLHYISYVVFRQPYITKAYFSMSNPPVNLVKIAIGDGTMGSIAVVEDLPVVNIPNIFRHHISSHVNSYQVTVLETYPQLIGYDQEVFDYFQTQCVLSCRDKVLYLYC